MSNRRVTYTLELNSSVVSALQMHEQAALRVDNAINQINNTLATIGVGIGVHKLIETAEDWIHGATEMENAMLRIKNVSDNVSQGIFNKIFIREEADKFKLDIQKATDTYGDFLTMVRGSGLAASEVRKLHDEVLTIGKITQISDGQMEASVRNLGKLLEEGTLEGRHLRPLTYQMSGLMPYISRELGLTNQELEKALASGKLTKAAIDSKVLLDAIEKYADDLKIKLPESLDTIGSALNDSSNKWLDFKNNVVFDFKPELKSLLVVFKDGAVWLDEHRDQVEKIGVAVLAVTKGYIEFKLLMFAVNGLNGLITTSTTIQTSALAVQATTTAGLNMQIMALNANLEIMIELQTAAAVASGSINMITSQMQAGIIGNYLGKNAAGLANSTSLSSNVNTLNNTITGLGASIATAISATLLTVGISWIALEASNSIVTAISGRRGDEGGEFDWKDFFKSKDGRWAASYNPERANQSEFIHQTLQKELIKQSAFKGGFSGDGTDIFDIIKKLQNEINSDPQLKDKNFDIIKTLIGYDSHGNPKSTKSADLWERLTNMFHYNLEYLKEPDDDKKEGKNGKKTNYGAGDLSSAHVRGNSSHYITINISDIIGMNNPKFDVKNMTDMEKIKDIIGVEVTKMLTDVVNDSQIISGK